MKTNQEGTTLVRTTDGKLEALILRDIHTHRAVVYVCREATVEQIAALIERND